MERLSFDFEEPVSAFATGKNTPLKHETAAAQRRIFLIWNIRFLRG
jgi:hypothetical protein